MAGILKGVDERTQLVGHNRLELLLFRLDTKQRYGINVFKVREVVTCPPLKRLPNSHPSVAGVATIRGQTFSVVDLQKAIGKPAVEDTSKCNVIVAEYNRTVQGFLVSHIEHIVNKHWEEINLPPKATGNNHFLTAVTQIDGQIVEILDVEKILYEITGMLDALDLKAQDIADKVPSAENCRVLVADDSGVARKQVGRTLDKVGVKSTMCKDGKEAFTLLKKWQTENSEEFKELILVISDVEMPEMDGYTLTRELRSDPGLSHLKILLHTSLSGVFDSGVLDQVKADGFLSKFDSDELAGIVMKEVQDRTAAK